MRQQNNIKFHVVNEARSKRREDTDQDIEREQTLFHNDLQCSKKHNYHTKG